MNISYIFVYFIVNPQAQVAEHHDEKPVHSIIQVCYFIPLHCYITTAIESRSVIETINIITKHAYEIINTNESRIILL